MVADEWDKRIRQVRIMVEHESVVRRGPARVKTCTAEGLLADKAMQEPLTGGKLLAG